MKRVNRPDIKDQETLDTELVKFSKANPDKFVTFAVTFGNVRFFLHTRKPQSLTTHGAEDCFRSRGGFFKNGKIVKPSATFVKQFNFCPTLG